MAPSRIAEAPRRAGGEGRVVGRDDDRRAALRREAREEVDHVGAGLRVEVAGRLVGEDHARLDDERARDRDALLLAARELRRQVRRALDEPDLGEQPERALARAPLPETPSGASATSTFWTRGQRRDQVVVLEDEAEGAQAQLGEIVVAERRRGRGPRRRRGRCSGGRARRGAGAGWSCRSRSALRARGTRRPRSSG